MVPQKFKSEKDRKSEVERIENLINKSERDIRALEDLINSTVPPAVRVTIESDIRIYKKGKGGGDWPSTFLRRHTLPVCGTIFLMFFAQWAFILIIPLYFINAAIWDKFEEKYRKENASDNVFSDIAKNGNIPDIIKKRFAEKLSASGHLPYRYIFDEREDLIRNIIKLKNELTTVKKSPILPPLGEGAQDLLSYKQS